ncbi:MAG: helix-turn-helix domain-containing protein [Cytophagaceae bacterium]|nr:helix-turn-helix domain-containing protein [Cytophagaceae bacterium]
MMVHIGKKIKEVFKNAGLTVTEFARRINTSRENVYGVFRRKSVDTEMLTKISKALNYDFFRLYSNPKEIEELRKQLEVAEQEILYLKKINGLLEKENTGKKK